MRSEDRAWGCLWGAMWLNIVSASSRLRSPLESCVGHSCVSKFALGATSGEQCWSPPGRCLLLVSSVGHSCVCQFALGVTSGEQCGSFLLSASSRRGSSCVSQFALGVTSAQQRRSLLCSRSVWRLPVRAWGYLWGAVGVILRSASSRRGPLCVSKLALGVTSAQQRQFFLCSRSACSGSSGPKPGGAPEHLKTCFRPAHARRASPTLANQGQAGLRTP